jgi:hypothetical protein
MVSQLKAHLRFGTFGIFVVKYCFEFWPILCDQACFGFIPNFFIIRQRRMALILP